MERLETSKFGPVEYSPRDVVEVQEGLPGFRSLRRFVVMDSPEFEPIKFLLSVDNPVLSFPVIDPRMVLPDYRVALNPDDRAVLGLEDEKVAIVYAIVTLGSRPEKSTANLFAPVVINTENMQATQVFLSDSDYSVTEPLLRSE